MKTPSNEDRSRRALDLLAQRPDAAALSPEEQPTDTLADALHACGRETVEKALRMAVMHHEAEVEEEEAYDAWEDIARAAFYEGLRIFPREQPYPGRFGIRGPAIVGSASDLASVQSRMDRKMPEPEHIDNMAMEFVYCWPSLMTK